MSGVPLFSLFSGGSPYFPIFPYFPKVHVFDTDLVDADLVTPIWSAAHKVSPATVRAIPPTPQITLKA